jgi:hypothetical protein
MTFRSAVLAILAATVTSLSAAAPPRALAWDDTVAARKLELVSGESSVPITDMHPSKRTGPLRVKGKGPFFIRATDKGKTPDGKPIQRACPIPETITRPLILLIPDETDATGLRTLVVDDNPAGFSWGTYRFINATPKELVVQLEQKAVSVPTGWKPVDLNLGGETRGIGARVALAEQIEKTIYSAVWEYNQDVRTICFLVPGTDPRLSPVAFKSVPEDKLLLQLQSEESKPE